VTGPTCRIVSSDYLDRDVYLNIRCFYASAGYRLIGPEHAAVDLLVVLRGDNGTADQSFAAAIHIYDYVKEYQVDWARRYPAARSIVLVSLDDPPPPSADPPSADPRLRHVRAYLPVIPGLWTCRSGPRRSRPVHVSNYKRMPGDPFQEELLALIQAGRVEVHGNRWEQVGVRARPLSYRRANRLIAGSASCFGLMWPYQRGVTLSGRMWQAPLNGCFVLSEPGTDRLGCPGVLERPHFDLTSASLRFGPERCDALAREAAAFWEAHTRRLGVALGFSDAINLGGVRVWRLRWVLWLWELEFQAEQLRGWLERGLAALRRRLARAARALHLHPRQLRGQGRRPHQ
jgi:hypothetical protein